MKNEGMSPADGARRKRRILLSSVAVLCVVYIFAAARPLSREIHFVPGWTIDADKSTRTDRIASVEEKSEAKAEKKADLIPFKLGQLAGYFTKNGRIVSRVTFPYKAAVSRSFYSLYETHSNPIQIFSPDGEKIAQIEKTGFPFFDGDRIFLFLPGGGAFSSIARDGSVDWTYEGSSPVTAFSSSKSGILAGYADGTLISFDGGGKPLCTFFPGGSEIPVILGAAISNSGRLVAAVCGHDGQRMVLASLESGGAKVVFHKYFDEEVNTQMLVKFKSDDSQVYYSCSGGVGVLDCRTFRDTVIPISGTVLSIQEDEEGTAFVLSRDSDEYAVSVIESGGIYSGSFSFEARTAFMSVDSGSLFVGHDSKISRIDIEHK